MKEHRRTLTYAMIGLLIIIAIFGIVALVGASLQKATDALPYATREEALEHCPNPSQVAGPLSEPSRGWRCPPRG